MTAKIWTLGIDGLTRGYRSGRLSPVAVMQACMGQVETYNPLLNAFTHIAADTMVQARASEARWKKGRPLGPLDGIPVTVKDWYDIKGWPTRQGSLVTSNKPKTENSFAVEALINAGALIVGKTTLPEFGHKGVTHSPLSGITRNPWDPTKTSGGSSGGAAVAAACGMGLLHLGSDAGGSVRIPAAFCGVVGFKPSPGLMPSWPPSLFSTMSSMGPLAHSVDDAALLVNVLAAAALKNPADWHNAGRDAAERALYQPTSRKPLRIAVTDTLDGMKLTSDAQKVWNRQKKHLRTLGTVETLKIDGKKLAETFSGHWTAVASLMARNLTAAQKKKLDKRFTHWVARGDKQHLHDYLLAEHERMLIGGYFKELFSRYDLLITPATPFAAFDAGIDMPNDRRGKPIEDWNIFSAFANLARLPALVLPMGMTDGGLPFGVQICGPYLGDGRVLAAGKKLEKALAFKSWLPR